LGRRVCYQYQSQIWVTGGREFFLLDVVFDRFIITTEIIEMKGYNKLTCVKFNEITTDKHLVFALCEKLRQNGIHIQQEKVYTLFLKSPL
jgi:hypothetical protein